MSYIVPPIPLFADLDGMPLENGMIYVGESPDARDNPISVYWDSGLTVPATQPIRTEGGYPTYQGNAGQLFIAEAAALITVLDSNGVTILSNADAAPFATAAALAAFIADLASTTAGKGASLVGNENGGGTVQDHIDAWSTIDYGALPAGTTIGVNPAATFSGHVGGTTDFRHEVRQTIVNGSNSIDTIDQHTGQVELRNTAGTVGYAFSTRNYVRLGYQRNVAYSGGDVTTIRVHDAHFANEGDGEIDNAACFFADGYDAGDDWGTTGTINTSVGFHAGNMGHATKVLSRAYGFTVDNMTVGAPLTVGYHSQMQDGTNRYALYFEGDATSQFLGNVGIGSALKPVDKLEVFQGYAKLCGSTTKFADGNYHEIRTAANDYTCFFSNSHASAPNGLRMRFAAASPNNTTQRFLYCDDPTADRLVIWSNGNVVNANNSYGAISDKRFKQDITDARSQIDDIRALRFRNYRLKSDPAHEHLGLVAQEVLKVSPGLVAECGEGKEAHYSLNYSVLYLKAAKALQEALVIIDDLSARITALEAK